MEKIDNWKLSIKDAVRNLDDLLEILEIEKTDLWINPTKNNFPILVPKSFISRMKKGDPEDPLLLQVLPSSEENTISPNLSDDPLNECSLSSKGIIKKYSSRDLLITTQACPIHCRYCFRKNYPYQENHFIDHQSQEMINDLQSRKEIKEIILSGGDPLSLSNEKISSLINKLEKIEHLLTIRIHTRYPIIIPERVDDELIKVLKLTRLNIIIVTHCNHANEIDKKVHNKLLSLKESGLTLLNQSVLLKNINDSIGSLKDLSYTLFNAGVLPYYLHQMDAINGSARFMVDEKKAINLIEQLKSQVSGYLVPKLVKEIPGELSKTSLA